MKKKFSLLMAMVIGASALWACQGAPAESDQNDDDSVRHAVQTIDARQDRDNSNSSAPKVRATEVSDTDGYTHARQTQEAYHNRMTQEAGSVSRPVDPTPEVVMGDQPVTIEKSTDWTNGILHNPSFLRVAYTDNGTWVDVYFAQTVTLTEINNSVQWENGWAGTNFSGTLTLSFPDGSSQEIDAGKAHEPRRYQLNPTSTDRVRISVKAASHDSDGKPLAAGTYVQIFPTFMGRY